MDLRVYLKNSPTGTKLYSLVSGEVTFKEVRPNAIVVLDNNHCEQFYHHTGRLWNSGPNGECLLFPSKENRDWDSFTKFKKGDIILSASGVCVAIVDHVGEFGNFKDVVYYQCCLNSCGDFTVGIDMGVGRVIDCKIASTHDKERILKKLHEHGYILKDDTVVKKRFDPKTFEPYQKVLVRSSLTNNWRCTLFSHMTGNTAICSGDNWFYCIPYRGNEHLRGTSEDCIDFYKWWENN